MRAAVWPLAILVFLGAISSLWAGPFAEVPAGHWAYAECDLLASLGMLSPEDASSFSGESGLTRFEFATAILHPLIGLRDAVSELGPGADEKTVVGAAARSLRLSFNLSETQIARAASCLHRLSDEFAEELGSLDFDPAVCDQALRALADPSAVRDWRAEALALQSGALALVGEETGPPGLRFPLARGSVALTLPSDPPLPGLLDHLARLSANVNPQGTRQSSAADPAVADPHVSRLRTAYEYGIGSAMTLSLAYEEIARRGQGLEALDTASLASVGIGYRLTPSTSVQLSYSLLDYNNYVLDSPPVRDRVAGTTVSIEF